MVATDPAMVKLPRVAGQAELLGLLPRQLETGVRDEAAAQLRSKALTSKELRDPGAAPWKFRNDSMISRPGSLANLRSSLR